MTPMKFGMGQALTRVEDAPLIKGEGRFVSDLVPEGALVGYVLRSPYAFADFTIKDVSAARAMKGVKAIFTHADLEGVGLLPCLSQVPTKDDKPIVTPPWEVLCSKTVRHVGDGVAFIVADTLERARDAAEAIEIDYTPRDPAIDAVDALKPGAPLVWPDIAGNLAGEVVLGDKDATEKAFAKAARTVELTIVNNRLITNYMETRGCLVEYDAKAKSYTLTMGSQGSHGIQNTLATKIFTNIPKEKIRVITPDVGGGFGTKTFMFREYPLCMVAAQKLKKPVAWVQDRSDHFMNCSQGRDNVSTAIAAIDKRGKVLAVKVNTIADMGAYLSQYATFIPYVGALMLAGVYAIPAMYVHLKYAYTNTIPVDAYRGAGRPEAAYLIERLMDKIALDIGSTPAEVRRRNFIKPDQFPWKTPVGRTYDSGEFDGHMTRAMEVAKWDTIKDRVKAAKKLGKVRGIGMATYIEACGGGAPENAWLNLETDGTVTLKIGTQSNGQGHKTAYAQVASQYLDIPIERINVIQGDTALVPSGTGTGGSRSLPVGGAAVDVGARALVDIIKDLAAAEMEVGVGDVEVVGGQVRVVGTDKSISYEKVASLPGASDKLHAHGTWRPPEPTFPNGTHIAEVEIDPDTGATEIVAYTVVDDFGVTINPTLLAGQVHGGIVQGIGQALLERTVYDKETGQLITASFMDYAMPRADHVPNFHFETRNVPCVTNLLGIKGAGEAGTIGACPSIMNAMVDALNRAYGITHIDMPATPALVWQTIQDAKAAKAA
ncbi:xanthine dehydrogenase family protein molybdopterin-binding subunit [Phreatobacter aquaticus]|uniref:Xanthine dehydrogenase family protein molybdopterin-binding subunit n=1 Tax=Phreatobacter aquaticus TaxID=2570229 RepID=A0A4D7QRB1_9HYPH|nr:xanthine dehydrogenase family protein molybdopterin-binding subunit [Phreatobacter aquaticus]QCK88126.1 xanthine dehydrogenase family protein molybdopterin-binding subunit [Phreatobacter aquaticus]